ncbi:ATP-binding protein [Planomonospora sp. ID91781]|nr:ATP-binding protein [Planomonospora sp. ID91781]
MTLLMRRRFAGLPDQIRQARRFVALAAAGRAATEQAVLMTSELATNAVQHTRSGADGFFEVSVYLRGAFLRVEVTDGGSALAPRVRPLDPEAEQLPGGRGLAIVELCATRWGQSGDGGPGRVVWFELPQDG